MKIFLIIFPMLILFTSCKLAVKKVAGGINTTKVSNEPVLPTVATSITLVTPGTSPNFISMPTVQVSGVISGEVIQIFSNDNCTGLISSSVATSSSKIFAISPLTVGTHNFYTNSTNAVGTSPCSALLLSYNYLGVAPTVATSIALFSPSVSPDFDSTPTLLLSGVVSGEVVKVYKNSSCTLLVGSASATGSSVQVTSSALAPGTYSFYTNSTNAAATSICSSLSVGYQYLGVTPTSGTSMVLAYPTSSPNYVSTPSITVSGGVANGDTVKIFTNPICTTQVGSALAWDTSVVVPSSALGSGITNFYTYSTNIIGSSSCSGLLLSYNYFGPSPPVNVSWTANRETAVNKVGGGYRVYYSTTSNINTAVASYKNVPYVSGPSAPISTAFSNLLIGSTYFKIVGYSSLNPVGGSSGSHSSPSSEFSVSLP
ncbi:MAG: hypothetical protein H7281_05155 [Bacteriovorax sp.]|nr:hypothetical protein [Bacteriovorax sp.]